MERAQPRLQRVDLERLHPTQITVGLREVSLKRKEWKKLGRKSRQQMLESHWFPGVSGPDGRHYIVDHHHLGLALLKEEVAQVPLLVLRDLSFLDERSFWRVMEHHQWVHPYDANGQRHEFAALPHHLTRLQDDPYRSLAGELRHIGGYAKDTTPFSEFLWADFLRTRIARSLVEDDFERALQRAFKLARSQDARYLPGWSGPIPPVAVAAA